MLTQNGAGDINVSFVNTKTLELCLQKAMMVEGVFQASAIPVIESRCIKSRSIKNNLQFSDFGHASNSSNIRHFYLVYLDEETVQISVMPGWRSCMDKQKKELKQGRVYCTSSVQSIQ